MPKAKLEVPLGRKLRGVRVVPVNVKAWATSGPNVAIAHHNAQIVDP